MPQFYFFLLAFICRDSSFTHTRLYLISEGCPCQVRLFISYLAPSFKVRSARPGRVPTALNSRISSGVPCNLGLGKIQPCEVFHATLNIIDPITQSSLVDRGPSLESSYLIYRIPNPTLLTQLIVLSNGIFLSASCSLSSVSDVVGSGDSQQRPQHLQPISNTGILAFDQAG